MDNVVKGIIIGAAVIIGLAIVSLGFLILRQSQDTAKSATTKIDNLNTQMSETSFTLYDGLEVNGSEVLNTIRQFQGEYIAIKVITGKDAGGEWYIYNATESSGVATIGSEVTFDLTNAQDKSNSKYINPNGRFTGSVLRDDNGSISAIVFEQR